MKHSLLIMFVSSIPLFCSCVKDQLTDPGDSGELIYLSFQTKAASIGSGQQSRDDVINEVRMIGCHPGTGRIQFNEVLSFSEGMSEASDPIKVESGRYDFLFIANESSYRGLAAQLDAAQSLGALYDLALLGYPTNGFVPTEKEPFLMSAFYRNVGITTHREEGATEENPILFTRLNGGNRVSLVRAFAKVELVEQDEGGAGEKRISKMSVAIPRTYRFPPDGRLPDIAAAAGPLETISASLPHDRTSALLYLPEFMTSSGKILLTVEGIGFERKEIELTSPENTWHEFMKMPLPEYHPAPANAVLRNVHYKVVAHLTPADVELSLAVAPWTLVSSGNDYDKAAYEVAFYRVGRNGVSQEIAPRAGNQTIEIHTGEVIRLVFSLKGPKGGLWRASLTNGLDFSLAPSSNVTAGAVGGEEGIADANTNYSFDVTARKDYGGTPRFTELYLVVNGTEIQLLESLGDEVGIGKRIVIKQVE